MVRGWLVVPALLLVCGCNFQIPSLTYIHETKLISVKAEVVELGPLNPNRVGVPYPTPIAEAMPGDRLALEAVIVTPDGDVLGAEDVESIWFQCGADFCGAGAEFDDPVFDVRCDELEPHTLDDPCRLGEGDVRFEFGVGDLGEMTIETRIVVFYGVLSWGERGAEDCWADRRARDVALDGCAFIQRQVKLGPSWWMLAYAETVGLTSSIPVWQIPIAVYAQQANRTPAPRIEVTVDGEVLGTYPDTTQFSTRLGDSIHIEIEYDETQQFLQTYFVALFDEESQRYVFTASPEYMTDLVYTTESILSVGEDGFQMRRDFVVDEYADPGDAQMFVRYGDDRFGEGVARLDFEVER